MTCTDHYEYKIRSYGPTDAPSVIQRFMNNLFRWNLVVIYINNILIYSWNETLSTYGAGAGKAVGAFCVSLYCRYELHQSSIQFFGYNISPERVQMDQGKVQAIAFSTWFGLQLVSVLSDPLLKLLIKRLNLEPNVLSHFRPLSKIFGRK